MHLKVGRSNKMGLGGVVSVPCLPSSVPYLTALHLVYQESWPNTVSRLADMRRVTWQM
jgi:hypothetical protein